MPAGEPRRGKDVSWRRDPVILARLPKVERMFLAGMYDSVIAQELGVHRATIQRDRERLEELWREQATNDIAAIRAEAVAMLRDNYRRSVQLAEEHQAIERAVIFGRDAEGKHVYVERPEKGSVSFKGSAAQALSNARQAIMDQAKLLGIVVDKVEQTVTVRQLVEDLARDLGWSDQEMAAAVAEAESILKAQRA